jgi:serine/threonine-protein kinase
MDNPGVPRVFDSNENMWNEKDVELFLVMEFITGPTLHDLVQRSKPTIDQSLLTTKRILQTLSVGHRLPLHHRDLKPDNVILRDGKWACPVIVDMGMAWHGTGIKLDYSTPAGTELGNRFLRLPEFAPGGEHRDARSDIAMTAGLLFFMLSGRAPRVLIDHDGRHPHEVEPSALPKDVLDDRRWRGLSGLLRVAFQQRIDARFRNADEFLHRLNQIDEGLKMDVDDLETEIAKLREITSSAVARERLEAAPAMTDASVALCNELSRIWRDAELQWGGQNPVLKNDGALNEFYCLVSRVGHSDPHVLFRHSIELIEGRFQAKWMIDETTPVFGTQCSMADVGKLKDDTFASARKLAASVISALNVKLSPQPSLAPFLSD